MCYPEGLQAVSIVTRHTLATLCHLAQAVGSDTSSDEGNRWEKQGKPRTPQETRNRVKLYLIFKSIVKLLPQERDIPTGLELSLMQKIAM